MSETKKIKWQTLENESGTGTLTQHAFVEMYDGNKMLCNYKAYMDDGNGCGVKMPWVRIKGEAKKETACKRCSKMIHIGHY